MSYRYISNVAQIKADSQGSIPLALRFMLDAIDDTSQPGTPKKTGNLRRNTLKSVLGKQGTIAWRTEYAVYQEDKQFVNYTTPNTGPHFAENAVVEVIKNADVYFKKANLI